MCKKILAYLVIFILVSQNAFAAASSAHVTKEAQRVIMTVNARIDAAASSIVSTLNSLLRDNKGMNIAQVVRDFQATTLEQDAAVAKQITEALNAHLAGMAVENQKQAALDATRKAASRAATVTPEECASFAMKKSAALAQATMAAYSTAGGNVGRSAAGGTTGGETKTAAKVAQEIYQARKEDPRALDAGILTRPGCTPIISEETAYADGLPVVGGYECESPSLTIPKADGEKAANFIAKLIVPNPAPELPVDIRKTPSGALYEAERDKVRMRQSYAIDIGQESGSRFQESRDLTGKKEFFDLVGLTVPNDKISEMDYLRYHVQARWDNPGFDNYLKNRDEAGLLRDIQSTLSLIADMQFRQLLLAERKTVAELAFYEAVQDGPSRAKLQELRQKAGM